MDENQRIFSMVMRQDGSISDYCKLKELEAQDLKAAYAAVVRLYRGY